MGEGHDIPGDPYENDGIEPDYQAAVVYVAMHCPACGRKYALARVVWTPAGYVVTGEHWCDTPGCPHNHLEGQRPWMIALRA